MLLYYAFLKNQKNYINIALILSLKTEGNTYLYTGMLNEN